MAQVIQILTVIDCKSILENSSIPPGTIGNETSIGSWGTSGQYVFMISSGDYCLSSNPDEGQGTSELDVNADSGDVVQWTVTDPSSGQAYSPVLYGLEADHPEALSPPVMRAVKLNVWQPLNTSAPTGPFQAVPYPDYVWESMILTPNVQIQYSWKFVILDNHGNIKGAYSWDPFITVS